MALDQRKYEHEHTAILRDVRPLWTRIGDGLASTTYSTTVFVCAALAIYYSDWVLAFADLLLVVLLLFFFWLRGRNKALAFKLPMGAKFMDPNNGRGGKPGNPEGILYLGNVEKTKEEVWFTNSDARTHVLYLGTTGSGKTEGLKSMVTNALTWGSGFVYVDGKADTDLWSSLSSLVRRLGRDDDLLVLNYMTGNSDVSAPSNTMNPFSSGSASYLVNMLVSLMPESEGDNAMWKERAVSLIGAMMPILTWKRDHQDMPLSVRTIRDYLSLPNVIKLQRDEAVPQEMREGIVGYLDTLPGFVGDAYDDDGKVKPPGPDTPQYDTNTASQQHGYLAMQFTRSLQSLGDDYGYIFDTQAADVDMVDIVLNRRILIVLIPALEKSGDEIANLGKIVASTMKGMMGSALGSTVEGDSATVIENKPTHSNTPFMTVFDEVGYYTAQGMAVMAAQARSLGFCLVFSGQDLPAMKKRVREEANSITANCNIKIFGKLEDPTETKEFFEKTVGTAIVTEVSGFQMAGGTELGSYFDTQQAGVQMRPRASYDGLRGFKEGQAVITFGETVVDCAVFYSNPGFAKAMRVTRFLSLPPPDEEIMRHANNITKLRDLMVNKSWTAERADVAVETPPEIDAINEGFQKVEKKKDITPIERSIMALVQVHAIDNKLEDAPAPPPKPAAPPPASDTKAQAQPSPLASLAKPKTDTPDTSSTSTPPAAPPAKEPAKETPPQAAQPPAAPPVQQPNQPPEQPPARPAAEKPKQPKLPKEIQDIIENAAKDARKNLFKDDADDGGIDAAE
ncbi:MAG: TraM recognition domain-containing protein [Pseudomonadota bacterium]